MPTRSKAGTFRHRVTVMRPTGAHAKAGGLAGADSVVLKDWPCSIETLAGREVEQAHTVFAEASHKVKGYACKSSPFKERDYLQFGERRLNIGSINDIDQKGLMLELLCEEKKRG